MQWRFHISGAHRRDIDSETPVAGWVSALRGTCKPPKFCKRKGSMISISSLTSLGVCSPTPYLHLAILGPSESLSEATLYLSFPLTLSVRVFQHWKLGNANRDLCFAQPSSSGSESSLRSLTRPTPFLSRIHGDRHCSLLGLIGSALDYRLILQSLHGEADARRNVRILANNGPNASRAF